MSIQYVNLGDVCSKGSSNIAQKDLDAHTGKYPIYGASGYIKSVDFYQQEDEYIGIVKDGAGVGRAMILPAKSSVIGTLQYIIPDKRKVNIHYLYYAIINMELGRYFSGATIPHIYFKDYQREKFKLPDLETQENIANNLANIDSVISKKKAQINLTDELVKSRFIEMFGNKKHLQVKIKNVCDFITKGTTPNSSDIYTEYAEGMIPYIKVYNLSFTGDLIFDEKQQFIKEDIHKNLLKRSKVYPKDVLMNIVGPPLGKFALVTNQYKEWNVNQAIAIFRSKSGILPEFLLYSLMQPAVLKPFLDQAVGIRQLNISLEQCRNIEIPLPDIDKQKEFVCFVEQITKSKLEIQKSLDKLEILKKSLMQQYFG